jgi:hypothetical protein
MKRRIKRLLEQIFGRMPEPTAVRDGLQTPQG